MPVLIAMADMQSYVLHMLFFSCLSFTTHILFPALLLKTYCTVLSCLYISHTSVVLPSIVTALL